MAYIVVLNPLILGGGADINGSRLGRAQAAATALVAGLIHPLMWGVAVLFLLYFLRGPIEAVLR
jgi:AGZA family xanthine/uracil permease-like MFS transporter